MATFPSTLPGHLATGHAIETKDQTVRSDMEIGPARVRRISTAANDSIPISWIFSADELEIFRDWFDLDSGANGGASWFYMPIDVGYGSSVQEVRFKKGSLKIGRLGYKSWSVASEVETR